MRASEASVVAGELLAEGFDALGQLVEFGFLVFDGRNLDGHRLGVGEFRDFIELAEQA